MMNKKKWLYILFSLFLIQMITWALLSSHLKERIQSQWWKPHQDRLLASTANDIDGKGNYVKALKFKTHKGVRLEFIQMNSQGVKQVMNKSKIPHLYDGFFEYRGESVQLAIGDIDGDGVMEIIAPTFDKNLNPYLNVYYYHKNLNSFYQFKSL